MPNRWAISSGNWSNTAIWNGGLGLPTASDDIWTNGQTVTIDTDISVLSLRNSATGSVIAGGNYVINNGINITAPNIISSAGALMTISQSNSATIIGNLSTTANAAAICLTMSATSSITITGSISVGNAANTRGIVNTSRGTLIITGSLTNIGGSSTAYSLYKQTPAGTVIITGSVFSGGGSAIRNEVNGTSYYILGDLIGGSAPCFQDNAGGGPEPSLYIIGNIYGATAGTAPTIYRTGNPIFISVSGSLIASTNESITITTGTVSVNGSIFGGQAAPGVATSAGTVLVNGPIFAGQSAPGVSTTTGTVQATGPFYNTNGRNAVFAPNLQLLPGSTPTWTFDTETNLEQRTLYTADFPGNFPSASNVRQGTVFGNTGQFTGTTAIPVASNVLKGVPVDATTGSASFTTQNVWSVLTGSLNVTGSIGERLQNVSTVATDGILITSKGTL